MNTKHTNFNCHLNNNIDKKNKVCVHNYEIIACIAIIDSMDKINSQNTQITNNPVNLEHGCLNLL